MSTIYTLNGKVLKNAANDKWLIKSLKQYYYDFGDQYTLVSNVAGSIDLSNTNINTASSKYVVLFQKVRIKDSWGDYFHGLMYSDNTNSFGIAIGDGFSTGLYYIPGNTRISRYPRLSIYSSFILVLEPDYQNHSSIVYAPVSYNISTSTMFNDLQQVATTPMLPSDIVSISTDGLGGGILSASYFKAAGFEDLEDAKTWVYSD